MRKTVYDQLVALQNMVDAWTEWSEYRIQLTDWILEHTEVDDTVLILGAGACNDYDLQRMVKHFQRIILLDLRKDSMEEALIRQGIEPEERKRIELVQCDLLGISEESYRHFSLRLQEMVDFHGRAIDVKQLADLALLEMKKGYEGCYTDYSVLELEPVDHVVACGLHSQLNIMYPWIWEAYCAALGKFDPRIHKEASRRQSDIVSNLHDFCFQTARRSCLFGMESERVGVQGGVEGAYQGLQDLERRKHEKEIMLTSQTSCDWNFNPREKICYQMRLIQYIANGQ